MFGFRGPPLPTYEGEILLVFSQVCFQSLLSPFFQSSTLLSSAPNSLRIAGAGPCWKERVAMRDATSIGVLGLFIVSAELGGSSTSE